MISAALIAAACLVTLVTFRILDPDLWQHLLVGRVIWTEHRVPTTQLWSWPAYGAPDVNPSWGFRALLWPFWSAGGVMGLFAWRWLMTLAAFALAWASARRLGARGLVALVVMVWCALVYRQRSYVRPENLTAVLLALEIWILETRRAGGPDRWPWLAAIACVWANVHVGWWFGFAACAIYLADALLARARGVAAPPLARNLVLALGAGLLASLVNPFGWRTLWAPFDYALNLSREPIFRNLAELRPVMWSANLADGLPLLAALWPLLWITRAARGRADVAEALMCALFTALGLSSQRFLGAYAVVAAPFVARGLAELVVAPLASRLAGAWPAVRAPWARAGLAMLACVAISIPELGRPEIAPGVSLDRSRYPERACDFVARHGVRGHLFNNYAIGGYLLWRFWPEPGRLPFMDIHQSGGPEIRREYVDALGNLASWRALATRHDIGAVILSRPPDASGGPLDVIGRDSSFALVFQDDAAAVLVRRDRFPALADSFAYRSLPAGGEALSAVRRACLSDTALRARVRAEATREAADSEFNAQASELLGFLAAIEDRFSDAIPLLEHAARAAPLVPRIHEQLGVIALLQDRPVDAIIEFRAERRLRLEPGGLDLRFGQAYQALGAWRRARAAYRDELRRGPYAAEAAESLAVLRAREGR